MQRFYVANSSWFDTHSYDRPLIRETLIKLGAKNIRLANNFGWSNQPKVVTFAGVDPKEAEKALEVAFGTEWIRVDKKDWH